MKRITMVSIILCLFFIATISVWAGNVTIPNTFIPGNIAKAEEVNANFNAVKTAVDDNNSRITAVERIVPVAFAFVYSDGTLYNKTPNVTSATWNASSSRYEITISGESYFWSSYVTIVTPISGAYIANTSSVGGKLLIYIYDTSGSKVQSSFQFVTFKY